MSQSVLCIGGACVDRKYHVLTEIRPASSNPSRMIEHWGGVARNVAENLRRLNVPVALLSSVGDDRNGKAMLEAMVECGIDISLVRTVRGGATSEYAAVIGRDGDMVIGVSDLRVLDSFDVSDLKPHWDRITAASMIFLDTNPSAEVIAEIIKHSRTGPPLVVDVVSEAKARKLPADLSGIDLLVLNSAEASAYLRNPGIETPEARAQTLHERGAKRVILTRGPRGYMLADASGCTSFPSVEAVRTDATGAGDALIAGTMYRLLAGDDIRRAARVGALVAAMTIESMSTVGPDMSVQWLESNMYRLKDA